MAHPEQLPDLPDQPDEDTLLNTGPVASSGDSLGDMSLSELPF